MRDLELILLENNVAMEVVEKIRQDLKEKLVNREIKENELEKEIIESLKTSIENILIEPENIIEKIINLAIQAPSGENCQPWRFEIGNNEIDIYNVPERDQSLYNTNQAGSYVAHGALVENMIISAKTLSYSASITLFPKSSEPDLVASITLRQSAPQEDSLLDSIAKRTTNRKPYMKTQLPTEQLERLAATSSQVDGAKAEFVTDPDKIKALAEACSVNEIVMFSNNTLHNFFFNHKNSIKN